MPFIQIQKANAFVTQITKNTVTLSTQPNF